MRRPATRGGKPMATPGLHWQCKPFPALSAPALYALLQLRGEVFVVEQACAYLDPDGLDPLAFHWLGWEEQRLVAHQRCLPPGTPYAGESSIGRIVVASPRRGRDLGRELLRRGIAFNRERWPAQPIRIGAQARLEGFYEEFGFQRCGEPYLEDGISHVHMRLAP